jgi:outer membrane biosynthesis protein TonB
VTPLGIPHPEQKTAPEPAPVPEPELIIESEPAPEPVIVPEPEPPVPARPTASNGRPRAKERAEAFVREQLANGPRHGESIKRDAAEYAKNLRAHADRRGRAPRRALPGRAVVAAPLTPAQPLPCAGSM